MREKHTSLFLIIIFIIFGLYQIFWTKEPKVLNIITPTKIQIDLNGNNLADDDETFCVPNLESFTSNLKFAQEDIALKMGLTFGQSIAIGYMADNFARKELEGQIVKLDIKESGKPDCKYADIFIGDNNYTEKLKESGFAISNLNPVNKEKFDEIFEKSKNLKLVILNHHSLKYHTLDCKYGWAAEDAVVLPENEITKELHPCKFCHVEQILNKNKNKNNENNIVNVPPPPGIITDGNIKLILTDFTTILRPDRNCTHAVCKEFLNLINNSKDSIDIAAYGLADTPAITKALNDAQLRGVHIRIVYDTNTKDENYYTETNDVLYKFPDKISDEIVGNPKLTNMLMHNKFAIFDNQKIYTGSMNFSTTGLSGFNHNNILIINSSKIANLYKKEFEQMYSGKFHTLKKQTEDNRNIADGNNEITVMFSPQDKAFTNIVTNIIKNSKQYIYIPTFIITHNQIKNELIKAKERGVDVKIIIDATNTYGKHSVFKELRNIGIPIKVENYAGKMHSKVIIVDNEYLITGSANLSNSGENKNDENTLIIKSAKLSSFYKEYFEYFWTKIPDKYLKTTVRAESKDSIGSCYDGVDNNFDGKIDNSDSGCK